MKIHPAVIHKKDYGFWTQALASTIRTKSQLRKMSVDEMRAAIFQVVNMLCLDFSHPTLSASYKLHLNQTLE